MDEREFQHNMLWAEAIQECLSFPDSSFWEGYRMGLNRHFHGENFGTLEQHNLLMQAINEDCDDHRRIIGLGYNAGFRGITISKAIKFINAIIRSRALVDAGKTMVNLSSNFNCFHGS